MSETPWVVFDARSGFATCLRCGKNLNLPLPQPLSVFAAASLAFCNMHKNCRETDSKKNTAEAVAD
jgi:hypothetical protein